jgi:hypothetical protein
MASASKSASKRASAAKRTSEAKHTESAERLADEATAQTPGSTALGTADRVTRPGNAETHDEHPRDARASEVAHAPASGTQRGEGGHPAGEYDITNPREDAEGKPTGLTQPITTDSIPTGNDHTSLLAAHLGLSGVDRKELEKKLKSVTRLSDADRMIALEGTLPGFTLEQRNANDWRCHVVGTNRFGHGSTAAEAVESYLLGGSGSAIEAAAQAFARLDPKQQDEIRERDRKALETQNGSGDPLEDARTEAIKTAKADRKAESPAVNAGSDGPERESARRAEGSKGHKE